MSSAHVKNPFENKWHSSDPGGSEALVVRTILSVTAVAIRFYCKSTPECRRWFFWDDFFILLALVSSSTGVGVVLWGLSNNAPGNPAKTIENYLLSEFIGLITDFLTLTFVRLSILSFFQRIFIAHPTLRKATFATCAVTILWSIAGIFACIFMCSPVSHLWHRTASGVCHNFQLFFLIVVIVEIVMDAFILMIPIPPLTKLPLSVRTRALVIGIFLLGIFVVITNILRLRYTYSPNTNYANVHKATIWTCVHITSAIICACLPLCKPFVIKVAAASVSLSQYALSLLSSAGRSRGSDAGSNRGNRRRKNKEGPESEGSMKLENCESKTPVRIEGGERAGTPPSNDDNAPGVAADSSFPRIIKVGNEFEVV